MTTLNWWSRAYPVSKIDFLVWHFFPDRKDKGEDFDFLRIKIHRSSFLVWNQDSKGWPVWKSCFASLLKYRILKTNSTSAIQLKFLSHRKCPKKGSLVKWERLYKIRLYRIQINLPSFHLLILSFLPFVRNWVINESPNQKSMWICKYHRIHFQFLKLKFLGMQPQIQFLDLLFKLGTILFSSAICGVILNVCVRVSNVMLKIWFYWR